MNIQEATKLAMEKGISIRRENQDVCFSLNAKIIDFFLSFVNTK
ncbi:hypothetical protein V543_02594, partial [Staphylococcus aureus T16619]